MDPNVQSTEEGYYAQFGMLVPHSSFEARFAAQSVRREIHARRRRGQYFANEMFGEPAWDMLLELFYAELKQVRMTFSRLSRLTGIAQGTVARWLRLFEEKGLLHRRQDPFDSRSIFIMLTPAASQAMHQFFKDAPDDLRLEGRD